MGSIPIEVVSEIINMEPIASFAWYSVVGFIP